MTNPAPVSVVIPAYNAERFIEHALRSVLEQTLPVAEVFVVDDGSADRTYDLAQSFGVRVIRQPNRGLSAARNAGIRAAGYPWVALLDADDVWARDKIERQWDALRLRPEAVMVCCDYYRVDDRGDASALPQIDHGRRRPYFLERGSAAAQSTTFFESVSGDMLLCFFPLPSTVMVRREAILACGLFDERLRRVEDMECFLRVLAGGSLLVVEQPLVNYRQHESSLTSGILEMQRALGEVRGMVSSSPGKYVPGAEASLEQYWRDRAVEAGRKLLAREQHGEARELLSEVLRAQYLRRAAVLFAFTYGPPSAFKYALKVKRLLVRKKVITELMELRPPRN